MENNTDKILIVDDISRNIQILGNILFQTRFQIAYAQSGQQALDICKTQDFDLILLDIMMPGMDGYEVCKRLKKNPSTSEIPIIFLTAKADMDSVIKGFDVGGQDYITKPFNAAELLARVDNHLLIKRQKEQLKLMNYHLEDVVKKRTHELEKANQQLSILDQAKSNFLLIISHEIRTPLNGVIGLTELLNRTNIDKDQQEYINHLRDVSARLVKFSDTALLITSLKINKQIPNIKPVGVNQLITNAIDKFKKNYRNSSLEIKVNMSAEDVLIKADPDLIMTCFFNIIENSSKFAGNNAQVEISATLIDGTINIKFCDNGTGFTDDAISHLFQLFSSGDILHAEGTGLGLATVKLILDAHEGRIDIKNTTEGGAEVNIKLNYSTE